MLFIQLFAGLLGFATFTSAYPPSYGDTELSRRGITWSPRGLQARKSQNKNSKNNVIVTDTTIIQLTEQQRSSEVQLTILVQEKLVSDSCKRKAKDNVRKNHYSSKNQNVDTIIVVITNIVDVRNSNAKNTRYMQHQLRANGKSNKDRNNIQVVAVTEIVAITIDSNSNSRGGGKGKAGKAQGTGTIALATAVSAAAAIQTIDANAPFQASNATVMLPAGSSPPSFNTTETDPAAIVEADQNDAFVSFS